MPPPDFDLAELRAHLSSARGELERWAAELAAGARAEKAAHDVDTERANGQYVGLVARERELSQRAEELAARLDDEAAELEALQEEAQQAREAADTLPAQVSALVAEVTAARQRTDAAKQAAARRAAGADAKLSGAAAFASLYAERLGMCFASDAPPGEWGVIFTNVDPAAPERPFRFALHVGDAAYTLTACEPPLATAGALVAALNAAPREGLPRFVAGMRAAFAQLARTGSDAAQLCA